MKLIKNRITRSCATKTQRMKYLCAQRAHHYTQTVYSNPRGPEIETHHKQQHES